MEQYTEDLPVLSTQNRSILVSLLVGDLVENAERLPRFFGCGDRFTESFRIYWIVELNNERRTVNPDVDVSGAVRQLTSPIEGTTVAIRYSASEAIRYSPVGGVGPKLTAYEIAIEDWGLDVTRDRTLVWDVDLEKWLEEYAGELEWVHPKWRQQMDPSISQ